MKGYEDLLDPMMATRLELAKIGRVSKEWLFAAEIEMPHIIKYMKLLHIELRKYKVELKQGVISAQQDYIDSLREMLLASDSTIAGMAVGWNQYWEEMGTGAERAVEMITSVLDGLQESMKDVFYDLFTDEGGDFQEVMEDMGRKVAEWFSNSMSDMLMEGLKGSVEGGWLGSILDKLGLGDFGKLVGATQKNPMLELAEKDLQLQQDQLTYLDAIARYSADTAETSRQQAERLALVEAQTQFGGYKGGAFDTTTIGGKALMALAQSYTSNGGNFTGDTGGLSSTIGSWIKNQGISLLSNKFAPQILTKLGLGGLSTLGAAPAGAAVMSPASPLITSVIQGSLATQVQGPLTKAAADAASGAVSGGIGELMSSFAPYLTGIMAGWSGGNIGYGVGQNVGATRGRGAGTATAAGVGGASGAALGFGATVASTAILGTKFGWLGTIIGAVVGVLIGLVKMMGSGDPTKRRRQGMGMVFAESLEGWREGDYGSYGAMMGHSADELRSANYMKYAQQYKHLPQTNVGMEYDIQKQFQESYVLSELLGGHTVTSGGSMNVMTKELEAYAMAVGGRFPETAKKTDELVQKMKKLWTDDVLNRFDKGLYRLSTMRKMLQNMGMEDAETKTKLLDMAQQRFYSKTLALGDIQIKRLVEDMKELTDEIEDQKKAEEGWAILLKAIYNGLDITGKELAAFRDNAKNLEKLRWIDIYEAMGIEKIALLPKVGKDMGDVFDSMRMTLATAREELGVFGSMVEDLPESWVSVKEAFLEVGVALTWLMDLNKELIDVWENWYDLPGVIEDLWEAFEAGDWGAVGDELMELARMAADVMEAMEMLAATFKALGATQASEFLSGISKIFMGLGGLIEVVYTVIIVLRILGEGLQIGAKWFEDFMIMVLGSTVAWDGFVEGIYDVLDALGDLFIEGSGLAILFDILRDLWGGAYIDTTPVLDLKELMYSLQQISEDTFMSMTLDIQTWANETDSGLTRPLTKAEHAMKGLATEFGQYIQYLLENKAEILDLFEGMEGEKQWEKMLIDATKFYKEAVLDLIKATVEPMRDFLFGMAQEIYELHAQMTKFTAIVAYGSEKGGKEWAEYLYWEDLAATKAAETARLKAKYEAEDDPAKRFKDQQNYYSALKDEMNAMLSANTAYYDHQRTILQELHDDTLEKAQEEHDEKMKNFQEAMEEYSELSGRKESFVEGIKSLLETVRGSGSGQAEIFNQARRDVVRLKESIGLETDEDKRLDLYEELKETYEKLWSSGTQLYDENTIAYQRLQEEVGSGLDALLLEGESEFDRQMAVIERQLEELTGIKRILEEDVKYYLEDLDTWAETENEKFDNYVKDLETWLEMEWKRLL